MKIYNKIVIDIESGNTIYEDSFEYYGNIALCGSSGGGGGGGDQETTVRYAPYVEAAHSSFLTATSTYRTNTTEESPYSDYEDIISESAFFGTGYTIASFPSLYDMYGKFMAGLDIDTLFSQIFEDTVNASEVSDLVSAEGALLDDDIDANVLPRFQVGMRNINSVMTSSYIIGKSLIEDSRVKSLSKFSSELKYKLIPVVTERWKSHLQWNDNVIRMYAEIMKLYYLVKIDVDKMNYAMASKDLLWPFEVLDYERANLGALQGASKTTTESDGGSRTAGAIGGAMTGAAAGAMATGGNPMGAVVGGILGLGASLF